MAQTATLLQLKNRIRERGEIRSVYVPDSVLTDWINGSIRDLYDRILVVNQSWLAFLGAEGTGDSFAKSGNTMTLTDSGAAFTASDVGRRILISNAASAGNNGSFTITAQTATTVDYTNASGVAETDATVVHQIEHVSVVAGTDRYDLPADFAIMIRVEVEYASDDWRPLFPGSIQNRSNRDRHAVDKVDTEYAIVGDEIFLFPNPTWAAHIRFWYVPTLTALSADTDTQDFIYGWEEYVILDVLAKHAQKEESDDTPFLRKQQDVLERILGRAKTRDSSGPPRIRNRRREQILARYPWLRDVT